MKCIICHTPILCISKFYLFFILFIEFEYGSFSSYKVQDNESIITKLILPKNFSQINKLAIREIKNWMG
jgi:hypothetical protein